MRRSEEAGFHRSPARSRETDFGDLSDPLNPQDTHTGVADAVAPDLRGCVCVCVGGPSPSSRREKCPGREGRSGDPAAKQSVAPPLVLSPSHSLPPFPLSNWRPQSCVSPHLPALKLHQPYLLLSLSMIIIITIVVIVVLMVRSAVIACYF